MFKLVKLNQAQRELVFEDRAQAWKKGLTVEEFCDRNRRLYNTSFGQKRMTTFALLDHDENILTSLDLIDVNLSVKDEKGMHEDKGLLIGSVITPEKFRRRGYATELLALIMKETPCRIGVLYSDVAPAFYEKFGFKLFEVWQVIEKANQSVNCEVVSISITEFIKFNADFRKRLLLQEQGNAAVALLDAEYIDWKIEKYRYFADLKSKPFPEATVFRSGGEIAWTIPDFVHRKMIGMWLSSQKAQAILHQKAKEYGFEEIEYWSPTPVGSHEIERPMIWSLDHENLNFLDVQLSDWW